MAIYRIFPDKDTIIFTEQNTGNAGKDEIIEVGGYPSSIDGVGQAARILIKFTTEDIKNVVDNKIGNTNFSSSLKLFLAEASELPVEYEVYAFPIFIAGSGD